MSQSLPRGKRVQIQLETADECPETTIRGWIERRQRKCLKLHRDDVIPPNSREATIGGALNGNGADLTNDIYGNTPADYAEIAGLDLAKWVRSYGELDIPPAPGHNDVGYDYINDPQMADLLIPNIDHQYLPQQAPDGMMAAGWETNTQGYQDLYASAPDMNLTQYVSTNGQANMDLGQLYGQDIDTSQINYMQPPDITQLLQLTSQPSSSLGYQAPNPMSSYDAARQRHYSQMQTWHSSRRPAPGLPFLNNSYRIQRIPQKPRQTHRGGRPVPPDPTDPRWNIWSVGDLSIRYNGGGVTVKHLQKVLCKLDKNKRTKHSYEELVNQVHDQRATSKHSMPENWNPTLGWWAYLEPE